MQLEGYQNTLHCAPLNAPIRSDISLATLQTRERPTSKMQVPFVIKIDWQKEPKLEGKLGSDGAYFNNESIVITHCYTKKSNLTNCRNSFLWLVLV